MDVDIDINTKDEIANLAKAGQHGKGFAVVAESSFDDLSDKEFVKY